MTINENQWASMNINGHQWKSVEINGSQWKTMEINVNQWTSVEINGKQWNFIVFAGFSWESNAEQAARAASGSRVSGIWCPFTCPYQPQYRLRHTERSGRRWSNYYYKIMRNSWFVKKTIRLYTLKKDKTILSRLKKLIPTWKRAKIQRILHWFQIE